MEAAREAVVTRFGFSALDAPPVGVSAGFADFRALLGGGGCLWSAESPDVLPSSSKSGPPPAE